ncbi:MAG: zinc ribbon domain-containing protein [Candidatus Lokiarchaeota archaeon]|nr:zinc ribbon domain-containing protein [Candidatus Lokiarchaeota archaeon]
MFCPNCGETLKSQNQKFCASCGSVILSTPPPEAPQVRAEEKQVLSPAKSVPVYQSKTIKVGGPGPHSKMCFAFALVSLALAGVGFTFGATSLMGVLMPYSYYYSYSSFGALWLIIAVILNITGLVFGILSRTNCSKARKSEPINTFEKVGSVFAIFGIVINSIPIVVVSIILIIMLIFLMMISSFYGI